MGDPRSFHFKLPPYEGGPLPEPPYSWFPGIKAHHAATTTDRTARSDGKVRAFVIHATAGTSSAGAMSVMFDHRASWHWLIPDEDEAEHQVRVWACAPESRAAWHVRNTCSHPDVNNGERNANYWSLGLEVVNSQGAGSADAFSDWQVEQAAALVRYAWSKYPDLVDVVSHAKLDPQRRSDPGANFPWERFQDLVLAATPHGVSPPPSVQSFRVIGPDGKDIDCDPHTSDGVLLVEARPLVEKLGFQIEFVSGTPTRVEIRSNP